MPRENCDHITPSPQDKALAETLVGQGWIQVSSKYRMIRRWITPPPTPEDLVRPELAKTYFGKEAIRRLRWIADETALRCAPAEMVEEKTLTISEHKAFKAIKNIEWNRYLKRNRDYFPKSQEQST